MSLSADALLQEVSDQVYRDSAAVADRVGFIAPNMVEAVSPIVK